MGLNLDCSDAVKQGLIDAADRQDRDWTNWTTFAQVYPWILSILNIANSLQDVCWSLYVGREACVPYPHSDPDNRELILPPIDLELDEIPWVYPPSGLDPQPNHLSLTFQWTCRLLSIARRIMAVVYVLVSPSSTCFLTVFPSNSLGKVRSRSALDSQIGEIE